MTDTAIKAAVTAQIKGIVSDKCIPTEWLDKNLFKTLGYKKPKVKRIPLNKTELVDCVKEKLNAAIEHILDTYTTKDIKNLIKNGGDEFLADMLKEVNTTKGVVAASEVKTDTESMLEALTIEQAWEVLAAATKWEAPAPAKKRSRRTRTKCDK